MLQSAETPPLYRKVAAAVLNLNLEAQLTFNNMLSEFL